MLGKKYHESGFTLIEVMIVCAIIGIASAISLPSYAQWKARHDLREAVSELSSELSLARVVAMNRNRQATVTIQLSVVGLINVSGTTTGGIPIFGAQTLNPNVTGFQPISGGVPGAPNALTNVSFSSMGLSTATVNQVIQIANARGVVYSVSVMPSGKVTWCATSITSICP